MLYKLFLNAWCRTFKDGEIHWIRWRETDARYSQHRMETTREDWATSRRSPDLKVGFKSVTVSTVNASNALWASSDIREFEALTPRGHPMS